MTLISRLVGTFAKLPPANTHAVTVERDLKVPMPDGVVLLADHYMPRGGESLPTILVRCPYGRAGFFGLLYGRIFAERGYQVLIQSTRGTSGSGGDFDPYGHEHDDGLATIAWLKQQPWFSGKLGTNGPSYLGYTQWAIAKDAGADVQAMAIQVSTSNFHNRTYAGGSFGLFNALFWTTMMSTQEQPGQLRRQREMQRKLPALFAHLPLRDLDELATGQHNFLQDWLENTEANSNYWQRRNFEPTVPEVSTPIFLRGGWYDIFLPWQVRDYRLLREAGKQPYLTIGPWAHSSFALMTGSVQESLAWFNAHLLGDHSQLSKWPVRVFVTGADEWRSLPDWPPPDAQPQRFYFQHDKGLAPDLPGASEPDHYRYDPADPTPSLAGPHLSGKSMPTDNRQLEARPDVLTYTSAPLENALEVIGPVQADLYVRSSLEHTDFFVRLCDVEPSGKSMNVCDALLRVRPGQPAPATDGMLHLAFDLWPTAHHFKRGHRLRVQVSSGAHPRYARNTGSGEPLGTATKLIAADQSIYHDPDHPSAIVLSAAQ
ncbi:MAG TPA: CocE/NonD family hydrolase [Ktedonobacterales bacterium]|nr:CocE/NonD family hydrolase [Ktedonobacterales bacterium]